MRTAGSTPATWPAATPNGNYKITGRIKDMIIRGGENIYPKEIEDFIYTHPKVQDVQVIGVPDEQYGEEIMACVILKEGEHMHRGGDARTMCATTWPSTRCPAMSTLSSELPHERRRQDLEVQDA